MRHDGRTHLNSDDLSAIQRRVTGKVDHLLEDRGLGGHQQTNVRRDEPRHERDAPRRDRDEPRREQDIPQTTSGPTPRFASEQLGGHKRGGNFADDGGCERGAQRPRPDPPFTGVASQPFGQTGASSSSGPGRAPGSGQKVRVVTNFVPLGVRPTLVVTQYDVFFEPDVKNKEGRREVIQALCIMQLLGDGHASGWCFDGGMILYSSSALALPLPSSSTTATWQGGDERLTGLAFAGTRRQVAVTLSFAATLQVGERFASTDFGLRSDDRKHLAVLDVCFKHAATSVGLKALGTALFDVRSERASANIKAMRGENFPFELWKGKRQTIVMTAKGPMMQLGAAAAVMLPGLKLDDFVSKLVGKQPEQLQMEDFDKLERMLREKNFRVKISSTHCRRSFILRGIELVPCSRSMFPCTDADGKETEMSVAAYFADKYPDHPLNRPTLWPCVCVGPANDPHKNRIPLELCSIISGQPAPVTPEIQAEMITATADGPESRFNFIEGVHRDMLQDVAANATPMAFEIDFGMQLIEADATILRSPVLQYKASGQRHAPLQDVQVTSGKGEWNLRAGSGDLGFYQPGRVDGFAVVKFERVDDRLVNTFISTLMGFARSRGMDIGRQEGNIVDLSSHRHGEAIEKALDTAIRRLGTRVGLVICFIGDKRASNAKELYPAIKRWSHVNGCIPTQCVQVGKATGPKLGTSPQFHAGVLLKINLKLGGANCICKAPDGLGILRAAPTMVMGYATSHPQPGSCAPSYSALVAALDKECTKFHTVVGSQRSRTEVAEGADDYILGSKVRECLRAFHRLHGTSPRRILFYRDGVAHNQFEAVQRVEIETIKSYCHFEGGDDYVPELTFIVVQQRAAARFAQQDRSQLLPGTIVTSDVVGKDGCVAIPLAPFHLGAAMTPHGPPAVSPDACVPPPRLCAQRGLVHGLPKGAQGYRAPHALPHPPGGFRHARRAAAAHLRPMPRDGRRDQGREPAGAPVLCAARRPPRALLRGRPPRGERRAGTCVRGRHGDNPWRQRRGG